MPATSSTTSIVAGSNAISIAGADMSLSQEVLVQNESEFQLSIDFGNGIPHQLGAWMVNKYDAHGIRSQINITASQLNNPVPSSVPSSVVVITVTQQGDPILPGVYPAALVRMTAANTNPTTPTYVTLVPPPNTVIIPAPTTPSGFTYVTQFDEVGTPLHGVIDQSGSGDTLLVAADATHKIRVLSYVVVVGAATTLRWKDSGGNLSGPLNIAANGGISASHERGLMDTGTNKALLLNSSNAVAVGGHFTYTLAPTH